MPGTLILSRDRGDESQRQKHLKSVVKLEERAGANAARLRRVATPDPGLRTMLGALIRAQAGQLAELNAAHRYLETGNRDDLTGPEGVLAKKAATGEAIRSFQKDQVEYLSNHGIAAEQPLFERRPEPPRNE
jgi:hypothetical protein